MSVQDNSISAIYSSNKKFVWIVGSVILLLIIISILYARFTNHTPTLHQDKEKVKEVMDSNKIWRQQWEDTRYRDSIQAAVQVTKLTGIEKQVNRVPQMLQQINKRTNDQIRTITFLSDDQQLALFTGWLSQTDSL
jgi:uncharacterized alpha/beta hydrolase family protein